MSYTPTLILGAGLTGLSCAHRLGTERAYRLIEKNDSVGGLARTRARPHGFSCDGTGHWLHLRNPAIKTWVDGLLGDNLKARERRARVYSKGTFTLYPFQANTHGLPSEVVKECLFGLIRARYEEQLPEPTNYKEWIRKEFGEGICNHFMIPYNEKIYGVPLDTLAADFAQKYIPRPSIEAVIEGALGLSKEALGYNATFVYPVRGGIGALPEAIHAGLSERAELGRAPRSIDLDASTVHFEDGEALRYDRLVSTIPLDVLVDLLVSGSPSRVPDAVRDARSKLRANSVLYFDIGVRGAPKEHQDYHWIYVPEADFPFYRVGSYTAVEPSLAPAGHRSYYVELGHYGEVDPARFEGQVLEGLRRIGILDDDSDVLFMVPNVLSPAYVLFDEHYSASRGLILDWVASTGVISVGRYGRWQYNAMEDAMLEGHEAAELVLGRKNA
ncbi:MAG: NAD(P)-binding protein [Myxococcales bacterium]|nr:NAD(P)-binding protein [Myxococcales bacterium]